MSKTLIIPLLLLIFSCGENKEKSNDVEIAISDEEYFEELYRMTYAISPDKSNSDTLLKTNLYPYIEAPIGKNINSVYCISFQLAWAELIHFVGGEVKLEKQSEALSFLNNSKMSKKDIDTNSIICLAGNNLRNRIKKEFNIKFNVEPEHLNNLTDNLIVYSYLQKILKFKGEFKTDQVRKINFNNKNEVWYFYYLLNENSLQANNVIL